MVARLHAKTDALMRAQGMTRGTVGDRYRAMFADPKYRYPNTDAGKEKLLADLNAQVEVIRASCRSTSARSRRRRWRSSVYRPSSRPARRADITIPAPWTARGPHYWINLRDTADNPSWTLPTLTYHEGHPGHHLQITLQQESEVPMLMKTIGFGAYAEGWALYSEELAVEMGMYENDPLGHIGMLQAATFRAVRLVVDSGMHDKR
jgi:uncharacterized protein (DUF885 family)